MKQKTAVQVLHAGIVLFKATKLAISCSIKVNITLKDAIIKDLVSALLDMGSEVNLISKKLFEQLKLALTDQKLVLIQTISGK